MAGSLTIVNAIAALVGILLLKILLRRTRQRAPLPPGPKGLPVIGNVLDMPKSHEWYKFTEWNEQYGMFSVHTSP